MSSSLNQVQLIGNMTADPEIRETPNGLKVATFSLATNQVWKDVAGVKQEKTDFHNIVAWKGLADIVEQYTKKGKKLFIQWRLQTRSWDDASWTKRYRTEVVTDNLILLSPKQTEPKESITVDDFPTEYSARKNPKLDEDISIEDIPFR